MGFNACFKMISAASLSGGGVTAPTLEVGLTLANTTNELEFDIVNNDSSNPAVVELAFSQSKLKAKTWDDGTATSPSFAMDPGSTRAVTFTRASFGSDNVTETVTATLADGTTASTTVTVNGGLKISGYLASLSAPTFEFLMNEMDEAGARMLNTGSLGSDYDVTLNNMAVATTSDEFDGKLTSDSGSDYAQSYTSPSATQLLRNTDRTYIFCWDNTDDLAAWKYIAIGTGTSASPWGWLETNATYITSQYFFSSSDTELSSSNGTHSAGGTPEDMLTTAVSGMMGSTPRRCLIAAIWDQSAGEVTMRWKQTGHSTGHTYKTASVSAQTTSGNYTTRWMGWTSGSVEDLDHRYISIIDHALTADEFDDLCALAGL